MSIFKDKTLMITGGTGSFGNAVLKRFLCTDIGEIRIFSRDEKKQDDMRHEYQAKYPDMAHKIKFYIGDVRSLRNRGVLNDLNELHRMNILLPFILPYTAVMLHFTSRCGFSSS